MVVMNKSKNQQEKYCRELKNSDSSIFIEAIVNVQ